MLTIVARLVVIMSILFLPMSSMYIQIATLTKVLLRHVSSVSTRLAALWSPVLIMLITTTTWLTTTHGSVLGVGDGVRGTIPSMILGIGDLTGLGAAAGIAAGAGITAGHGTIRGMVGAGITATIMDGLPDLRSRIVDRVVRMAAEDSGAADIAEAAVDAALHLPRVAQVMV